MLPLLMTLTMYLVAPVSTAPQMFIWNCQDCPYGTKVARAGVEFTEESKVQGSLMVSHIVGEGGDSSLEIRGPLTGLEAGLAEVRIHSTGDCTSLGEVLYSEQCRNCQSFISIKVLASKKSLTLGGENDVLGKTISIYDASRGSMVGCGSVAVTPTP